MQHSLSTGRFRTGALLALAAAVVGGAAPRAQAADAATRAKLFQAEARRIFEGDHWTLVRKEADGFTAVHRARSGGPTSAESSRKATGLLMLHVSVKFAPKALDSTGCAVKIEGFLYSRKDKAEKYSISGPFKADYPANANYVRDLMAAAEDRLCKQHPEYDAQ